MPAAAPTVSGCTRDRESSRGRREKNLKKSTTKSRSDVTHVTRRSALSGLRTPPPRLTARLTTSLASPTLMLCMSRATDACLLATIEPAARRRRGARNRKAVEATQVALRQEEQRSPWYMIAQDCRLRIGAHRHPFDWKRFTRRVGEHAKLRETGKGCG